MKNAILFLAFGMLFLSASSQSLNGTYSIPGDYPTLNAAATALAANGVSGPVIFNVAAGYTETAPASGIVFNPIAGVSSTNTIVFHKASGGADPLVTAYSPQPASSLLDGIIKLVGADYLTFDHIDVSENASNNTVSTMTEFGYALLYASPTDGAQYNRIQNCTITLNRTNPNSFGIYSNVRHSATDAGTVAENSSFSGSNSYNGVYGNTISNVSVPISFVGNASTGSLLDAGNDVGGTTAGTGNSLSNWGGLPSGFAGIAALSCGLCLSNQLNANASYNTINSGNNGNTNLMYGIYLTNTLNPASAFTNMVCNNTITVIGSQTTLNMAGIGIGAGSSTMETLRISGNLVQNCSMLSATSGVFNGIVIQGNILNTSINNNVFSNNTYAGTTGTLSIICDAVGTAVNDSICGNTIALNNASTGTADGYGIWNKCHATNAWICNNTFQNIVFPSGFTGAFYGVFNFFGVTNCFINGNNFNNLTLNFPGDVRLLYNDATGSLRTMNRNYITTGLTRNTTGSNPLYLSYSVLSTGTDSVCGNNFSGVGSNLNVYGIYHLGTTLLLIGSNTLSSNTETSSGSFYGIDVTATSTGTVYANVISSITLGTGGFGGILATVSSVTSNTVSGISGSSSNLAGIQGGSTLVSGNTISNMSSSYSGSINMVGITANGASASTVSGNTIYGLSASSASTNETLYGIYNTSGTACATVAANNIYDIDAYGTNIAIATGIEIFASGSNASVYNNFVSNLRAPNAGYYQAVVGIYFFTHNSYGIYHNTIVLGQSGTLTTTGTLFGVIGIYYVSQSASTQFTLRNNIISVNATPAGTGIVAAIDCSSGTANTVSVNYNNSSNNNLLYVTPASSATYLYAEGTSAPSVVNSFAISGLTNSAAQNVHNDPNFNLPCGLFKQFMTPRESFSFNESPTFAGGATIPNNLIVTGTSYAESGGQPISSPAITTDYFNNTRNANYPDIGAAEFSGTLNDQSGPAITFSPLTSACLGQTHTISATITDINNINTNTGTKPRLWFKKSTESNTLAASNDNLSNGWKYVEASNSASPFLFTFDFNLLNTPAAGGDIIQYFVDAQDLAVSPNVSAYPVAFTTCPTSVALASANFPVLGTPTSNLAQSTLNGIRTVGVGGDYATLTAAATDYNNACLTGEVVFSLIDASYPSETYPITFSSNSYAGPFTTLTVKPAAGNNATMSGSTTTELILLNKADYITLDGSNNGTSSRNWSITQTNSSTAAGVIWLASASGDGATNDTIMNMNITGNGTTTTASLLGSGGASVNTVALSPNSNNTFSNNNLAKGKNGIVLIGGSTADQNNVISNNVMNAAAANNIGLRGIEVTGQNLLSITGNDIENMSFSTNGNSVAGICLGTTIASITTGSQPTSSDVKNYTLEKNVIGNLVHTSSSNYAYGIVTAAPASGTGVIRDNMIYNVQAYSAAGIYGCTSNSASTLNIYHNTINLSGTRSIGTFPVSCIMINGSNQPVNIKNNIFVNSETAASGTGRYLCMSYNYTTFTNLSCDYNDALQPTGANPNFAVTGTLLNTGGTVYASLSAWNTATGEDAHSKQISPTFVSAPSNLHLTAGNCSLKGLGTNVGVANDFDGDAFIASNPDMGADVISGAAGQWSGNVSSDWNGSYNWCSGTLPVSTTDVTLTSGALFQPLLSSGNGSVDNITIGNGSSLTLGSGNLNVYGNFSTNGTGSFSAGSGTITLAGSAPQTLSGTNTFNNLTLSNTNGGVALSNDLSVTGILTLNTGVVTTGSSLLNIINPSGNAVVAGAGNPNYTGSWINGNLRRSFAANTDTYDFPVGSATTGNLLQLANHSLSGISTLTCSIAPKAGTDAGLNVTSEGSGCTAVSSEGVWSLTPDAPASSGTYDLSLYFNGFSGLQDNHQTIVERPEGSSNAADWQIPAGSTHPANGSPGMTVAGGFIQRLGMSTFSEKGIGEFGEELPVSLLRFTGHQAGNGNLLSWVTASEQNSSHFVVERSSDGIAFQTIGTKEAAGTSFSEREYSLLDAQPGADRNYYRLKMLDKDGSYQYSNVLLLTHSSGVISVSVYPNPAMEAVHIRLNTRASSTFTITISDVLGKCLLKQVTEAGEGENNLLANIHSLDAGIYVLVMQNENGEEILKQQLVVGR